MIETLAKSAMVVLLAVAVPVDAGEMTLWAQWGLAGVVVAYVLWRDWQREKRLSAAIEAQQQWIRDTLVRTLERNAAALERVASLEEQRGLLQQDPRTAQTQRLGVEGAHAVHR